LHGITKTNSMAVIEHIKGSKDKVKYYLETNEKTRDSDALLVAIFWYNEIKEKIDNLSAKEFLKMVSEEKVTSAETIRRNRQLLQAEFPELTGTKAKRRKKEEKEVRNEINK